MAGDTGGEGRGGGAGDERGGRKNSDGNVAAVILMLRVWM